MLEAYSKGVSIAAGAALTFSNNVLFNRCTAIVLSGAGTVAITKPGLYEVVLDGVVLADTAGDIEIQMIRNGVALPQGSIAITGATTATGIPFSVRTFVEGPEGCCRKNNTPVAIQWENAGEAFTGDVHVTVNRVQVQ